MFPAAGSAQLVLVRDRSRIRAGGTTLPIRVDVRGGGGAGGGGSGFSSRSGGIGSVFVREV